jgi:hypothetical protein
VRFVNLTFEVEAGSLLEGEGVIDSRHLHPGTTYTGMTIRTE